MTRFSYKVIFCYWVVQFVKRLDDLINAIIVLWFHFVVTLYENLKWPSMWSWQCIKFVLSIKGSGIEPEQKMLMYLHLHFKLSIHSLLNYSIILNFAMNEQWTPYITWKTHILSYLIQKTLSQTLVRQRQ